MFVHARQVIYFEELDAARKIYDTSVRDAKNSASEAQAKAHDDTQEKCNECMVACSEARDLRQSQEQTMIQVKKKKEVEQKEFSLFAPDPNPSASCQE